ncbi:MAG TPA: hypothetical protein VMH26_12640 [Burkholderiales bacterium]|nr:hypothetical protein [Burkholderiales bacterium]
MRRVNKAVELLEQRQPVYFEFVDAVSAGGYDGGRALAQTWADYIAYDMEHSAFDVPGLMQFVHGLADGGPTRSGHRTPAVIVTLPVDGTDEHAVRANGWMIKQVLAAGVHGLLLCHAESPEAVRAFVEAARYAFTSSAGSDLGAGRRGHGGQTRAASCCSGSRSRTRERLRTRSARRESRGSRLPSGAQGTWACRWDTRISTTSLTRPRCKARAPGSWPRAKARASPSSSR